jgi:predicted Zn-dependent protease
VAKPDSLSPDDRGSHDQTRAALARTRQSFGLPAGDAAGIPSDAEPPRAPGLALLSCEINLRQNRVREAGRRCDTALAAMDQLPRAHYLKAHVRMTLGDHAGAVSTLRRALALDPEQAGYREDLIRVLRDLGRTKEAAEVVAERVAKPTATSASTSAPAERAAARPRRPFDAFAPPPPMP